MPSCPAVLWKAFFRDRRIWIWIWVLSPFNPVTRDKLPNSSDELFPFLWSGDNNTPEVGWLCRLNEEAHAELLSIVSHKALDMTGFLLSSLQLLLPGAADMSRETTKNSPRNSQNVKAASSLATYKLTRIVQPSEALSGSWHRVATGTKAMQWEDEGVQINIDHASFLFWFPFLWKLLQPLSHPAVIFLFENPSYPSFSVTWQLGSAWFVGRSQA